MACMHLGVVMIKLRSCKYMYGTGIFTQWPQGHLNETLAVWYKTKFGSQNFGYQIWCLLCYIYNVFKNMFHMSLMIIW